jgi:dual specificity phosphatase 12
MATPPIPFEEVNDSPLSPALPSDFEIVYCCKRCRKALFRDSNLNKEDHDKHTRHSFHNTGKKAGGGGESACTSYFLKEPEKWMELTEIEGKLTCPGCQTRFGSYVWAGSQCSCGFWVVPAIQIPKSKADYRKIPIPHNQ